ncbi:acyl-CoA dehydrogenase family protein [Pseudofrankia sp. BMG5.37]|uniref:acyl-CoA dehydrogenase family protein n=1 Tax=Pseudofrankia sp. BMG5.37 TaxID=3050035 RepID=UPI002895240E|nr:acyl-CoA dehydrogenase family protein [Pseudofrankia sp. BMG5.37]MDT3442201.1 acyl-CoA dehydrogenase family protein [Pseudofrankia sp. BMG5.37]
MADLLEFPLVTLGPREERLRSEVRHFLSEWLPAGFRPGLGLGGDWDAGFSRALADHGWVGMAIPEEYGGHGRGAVERFVVTEELLAVGAPIGAHWVADRQTGPMILHHGTEGQRRRFLPSICAGTCFFSIGMSESEAGSDLAAVRTTATKVDGGWRVTGTKIWTSYAHRSHYLVALCRTSPAGTDRHRGLSQLIVDLSSPGVTVSPIRFLDGSHDFNEVAFEDVFVADDMVLGEPGAGWAQVTSELVLERGGPDRFLSAFVLLRHYLSRRRSGSDDLVALGRATAELWTIRQLGLSVAYMLDRGGVSPVAASMVKDLGTQYEQRVVDVIAELAAMDADPSSTDVFESLLAEAVVVAPSFTIRGGTTEVLRVVAARGLKA